jgi:hypothetical protein
MKAEVYAHFHAFSAAFDQAWDAAHKLQPHLEPRRDELKADLHPPSAGPFRDLGCPERTGRLHLLAPILVPEVVERTPGVSGYLVAKVRNASSVGSQIFSMV